MQSAVPSSTEVDAIGTLRFLDAIKEAGLKDKSRFYQASTSELYGKVQEVPQTEKPLFIRVHPVLLPSSMPIGLWSIIGKLTVCTLPMGFCLTMSRQEEAKLLLLVK